MGKPEMSTPAPFNPQQDLETQVDALVKAQLAQIESKYQDRIDALEAQLKASGPPATAFTEHAAGPNYQIAPVWCQAYQEASRNGTLTPEMLAAAGIPQE